MVSTVYTTLGSGYNWVSLIGPTFKLNYLNLANCNLNKKNGHVVPSFNSTQVLLEWLDLTHNLIEGSIPCHLLFNRVSKFSPWEVTKLMVLFFTIALLIDHHHFDPLTYHIIKSQILFQKTLIGDLLPDLYHVNMSLNALEGIIPWSFGNLYFQILDLSNNMLSGKIPQSLTRDGIPLVYLNLSNNKLKGEMLPRDTNMTWLECLQLNDNWSMSNIVYLTPLNLCLLSF